MTIPTISLTVIDPGALARPANTSQKPIYIGVCESGTDYEVHEFAREEDLLAYGGAGHLIDVAQSALQFATSVKIMKVPRTTAGTFEADSTDDPLVADSFTGTPLQFLKGQILITDGALISGGTCKARLSLDNWDVPNVEASFGDEFTIAASGIVTLPNTGGLAVHLAIAQTPADGDTLDFTATPGHYSSTEVAATLDGLLSPLAGEYTFLCFTGEAQTASAANTLAGGIASLKNSLYAKGRFIPELAGAGLEDEAAIVTAFASTSTDPPFLSIGAEGGYWQSPRSTPTRGRFLLREHEIAAIKITGQLVSTDPGRAADGAIEPIRGVTYDAAIEGSTLHDARIGTLRSWAPMSTGYFITRQRMLAASDSNFESWQFAAVMCFALRDAQRALFRFALESMRRTATGALDPRDAADMKAACEAEIDADLLVPRNVRGVQGHISARKVTVDLTVVLPALKVAVRIRPLGYPTDLEATLEYGNAD